ncbi:MAG: ATPase, partial [Spirochaetia bacterium]|nr:ATPase [Spirochaetia bacterium]
MNLFTKEMKLLTAVVLEQKTDKVVKTLLSLGVLDFVHVNKLGPEQMEKLSSRPSSITRASLEEMRLRVEAMLKQGHVLVPSTEKLDVSELQTPQMNAYRSVLDELTGKLLALKEQQKQSNQHAMGLEEMRRYMQEDKGEYLDLRVGEVSHGKVDDLSAKLSTYGGLLEPIGSNNRYISLTLKRDISQVDPLLQKYGWLESGDVALQKEAFLVIHKRLE